MEAAAMVALYNASISALDKIHTGSSACLFILFERKS
jgi:hypothetical protein